MPKKSETKKSAPKAAKSAAKKEAPSERSTFKSGYPHRDIEPKWQQYWEDKKVFHTPDFPAGEKTYVLDMFPYPSAEGLHVGHPEGYTATDIVSRFLRMNGKSVLHPMGWDAFGLPAENYALKTGVHPKITTAKNIEKFKKQIQSLGLSYDWSREVNTTDPEYYKWTQWIFLKLYQKGLAYEAEVPINWCPKDKTGLANEEVVNGRCERCGTEVERRKLRQWILKITAYADRLVSDLEGLDWPESIKRLQRDWVGKKTGAKVKFKVRGTDEDIEIFTTRLDTVFGATFLVLAPEHPLINSIITPAQEEAVKKYIAGAVNKLDLDRELETVKTGVFTGAYAINPINNEEIPIWVGDYVMSGVGSGAIMAVPGHDERDFDFAEAHDLEIRQVIKSESGPSGTKLPFTADGIVIESGSFTDMHSPEARKAVLQYLEKHGEAEASVTYKLRDWIFSRQRYWGEPIPLIHCSSCGTVPVPEEELPVKLPDVEKYEPTGTGESPLAGIESFVNTTCPKCSQSAKRETNTMPQWAGSCWYYLRFLDPKNGKAAWDKEKEKAWLPVDLYVGGAEHAVLHLLYARFWHKVLFDLGYVSTSEPFRALRNQGLILGPDGQKMSKSRGNVINPDDIIAEYGADTLRLYEMFMGPFEDAKPWNTRSMIGINRFLNRIWDIANEIMKAEMPKKAAPETEEQLQVLVNKITAAIPDMKFNTSIAWLMEFSHVLTVQKEKISKKVLSAYILLLSPFAPHLAEELWQMLGNKKSIQKSPWPKVAEIKAKKEISLVVQVNGKFRDSIMVPADANKDDALKKALESEKVKKHVSDESKARSIYVPGKVLNIVI